MLWHSLEAEHRAGDRARLCGLKSRAVLNGMECEFIDFDELKGRWIVHVNDEQGNWIMDACIRPQNAVTLGFDRADHLVGIKKMA